MRSHRLHRTSGYVVLTALGASLLAGCSSSQESHAPRPASELTALPQPSPNLAAARMPEALPLPSLAPTPEQVGSAWKQGVSLFDAGDYVNASAQLQIAASGRAEDAYTHYLLGLSLQRSGARELAEQAFERAAALDPHSKKTWINLARVRLELDKAQTALEAADSALGIDPLSADAMHQKGRALATLGRSEEALDVLRRAHEADSGNGYIANTLGYWLIQSGRPAEALTLLEAARDALPQVSYVRNNLGVAYERTGRLEDARSEYRAALQSGDSGGKAALSLARLGGAAGPEHEAVPVASAKSETEESRHE